MTTMILCTVKDRAIDAFGMPIFVRHQNEALRSFKDQVNEAGTNFNGHPDDYDLYRVGTYDDQTGLVSGDADIVLLARGKDLVIPTV